MAEDTIFKKATFGGFDRNDVMAYIDKMKKHEVGLTVALENAEKRNTDLQNQIDESAALATHAESIKKHNAELTTALNIAEEKNAELQKELDDSELLNGSLKSAYNSMKNEYEEKIAELTSSPQTESADLRKKYEEAESRHSNEINSLKRKYEEMLSVANKKNEDLKKENEDLKNSHNSGIESIKNQYEEKIRSLEENADANRIAEERVGTVMLDIRRYADLLIKEICDRIDGTSDDVDKAVSLTLSRIIDVSSLIQSFSYKVNNTLSDLMMDSENICSELTAFKGSLKVPFDEAAGKMHNEVFKG